MIITEETLNKEIESLEQDKIKLISHANAIEGALQECRKLLVMLKEEPK